MAFAALNQRYEQLRQDLQTTLSSESDNPRRLRKKIHELSKQLNELFTTVNQIRVFEREKTAKENLRARIIDSRLLCLYFKRQTEYFSTQTYKGTIDLDAEHNDIGVLLRIVTLLSNDKHAQREYYIVFELEILYQHISLLSQKSECFAEEGPERVLDSLITAYQSFFANFPEIFELLENTSFMQDDDFAFFGETVVDKQKNAQANIFHAIRTANHLGDLAMGEMAKLEEQEVDKHSIQLQADRARYYYNMVYLLIDKLSDEQYALLIEEVRHQADATGLKVEKDEHGESINGFYLQKETMMVVLEEVMLTECMADLTLGKDENVSLLRAEQECFFESQTFSSAAMLERRHPQVASKKNANAGHTTPGASPSSSSSATEAIKAPLKGKRIKKSPREAQHQRLSSQAAAGVKGGKIQKTARRRATRKAQDVTKTTADELRVLYSRLKALEKQSQQQQEKLETLQRNFATAASELKSTRRELSDSIRRINSLEDAQKEKATAAAAFGRLSKAPATNTYTELAASTRSASRLPADLSTSSSYSTGSSLPSVAGLWRLNSPVSSTPKTPRQGENTPRASLLKTPALGDGS